MGKKLVVLLLLFIFVQGQPNEAYAKLFHSDDKIIFTVKSSSSATFQTDVVIEKDHRLVKSILKPDVIGKVFKLPLAINYFSVEKDDGTFKGFLMDDNGEFYDFQTKEKLKFSPKATVEVQRQFNLLREEHFGELMDWEESQELIPKFSKFEIIDLETGLRFNVQRRAGSNHGDVQPLTKEDTRIMKQIYDDKWSWKRRAVLVNVNDRIIAASIHGMPHGAGALDNGFPGHFCIHFKGSKTHTKNKLDLSHQAMIHKAAGNLPEFVNNIQAEELAKLFFIALNQRDLDLFHLLYGEDVQKFKSVLEGIRSVRIIKEHAPTVVDPLVFEVPIHYEIKTEERTINDVFTVRMMRDSPTESWKVVNVPFTEWDK